MINIIDNLIKKKEILQSIQNKILKKSLDEYNQIYEIKLANKFVSFNDKNSDEIINLIETKADTSKNDANNVENIILKIEGNSSDENLVETTSKDNSSANSETVKKNKKSEKSGTVYISDDESIVIKAKSTKRKYTKRKNKKKVEIKNGKNA